jgi:hypothetical protein
MTDQEHKQRHIELHKALDELFADYIAHHINKHGFTSMPVLELAAWSQKQTIKPT